MEKLKPTNRSFDEICKSAQEDFYNANSYYPTVEEAVWLTEEAREEIAREIC